MDPDPVGTGTFCHKGSGFEIKLNDKSFHAVDCSFCTDSYVLQLKGQCREMDIFFEGLNILISTFFVCSAGFQGLSKAFQYPIQLLSYYFFLRNYSQILKMLAETLLTIPFSVIGRCSLVPTSHWMQGKCARINLSLVAFSIVLQNHRRLPVSIFSVKITALGSLKRVTGRIFKISK